MRALFPVLLLVLLAACPGPAPVTDPCAPNPCTLADRTVCTAVDGAAVCSCRAGFEDLSGTCVQPGACGTNPCTRPNRSVCVEVSGTAECRCDEGYRDDGTGACVPTASCTPNPCTQPNRTVCAESNGTVTCSCVPGTRDDGSGGCVSTNPCAANPCTQPNRTVCVASGSTAVCQCDMGYRDDGSGACVKVTTCTPNPCTQPNRSVCTESSGTVSCDCDPGYRLDATNACVPVVACTPNPCTMPNRGVCTDVGGTAVCGCNPGYEDRNGACVQTDPCSPNPCTMPNQGVCAAGADAGVSCGCNPGYQPGTSGCELIPPPTCTGQHTTGDVYEPDECPALAKEILDGVAQSHTFEPAGDVDWVKFTVDAGAVVQVEESGPITTFVSIYEPNGTTAFVSNVGDRVIRKLPTAGTWYVQLRANGSQVTGATTVQYTNLGYDDYGDTNATATPVALGNLTGRFDFPGDWDVLAVPVQAGRVYRFEETTSADVYVYLQSATATLVATRDSPESVLFKAPDTGTLFFGVRLYNSAGVGNWAATLTDLGTDDHADGRTGAATLAPATSPGASLSGVFEYPGDWDCLAVPVTAGTIYRFEESGPADVYVNILTPTGTLIATNDVESFVFEAAATEALTFCTRLYSSSATGTWTLRVTDLGTDDHADGRAGAATLTPATSPGASLSGSFEYPVDWDCLAVPVTAGTIYRFEETGAADVYLNVLTPTGTLLPTTDDESFIFEASTSETLTFCTRLYSSVALGSWTLRVTDLGTDDHADGRTGAATLAPAASPGATLSGQFQYPVDWDCLAVPVTAGRIYRFEETTLFDVYLNVLTPTGTLVATTDNENATIEAATSETLTVCVRPYSSFGLGSWTLRVTDLGTDDHGDARTEATGLAIGAAAVDGAIQFPGDVDFFSFDAVAGSLALQVITTGVGVSVQVQNSSGTQVAFGSGPGTFTFSVPSAGTYFVRLSGSTLGSYTVRVSN
jgi:subtilisin-like proprotein convertase family protein